MLSLLAVSTAYGLMQHLLAHAAFKSSLFMVIGLLLHSVGMQDSRALPSIASTGTVCYATMLCIYQSVGWVHSPTWITKKLGLDAMAAIGPS